MAKERFLPRRAGVRESGDFLSQLSGFRPRISSAEESVPVASFSRLRNKPTPPQKIGELEGTPDVQHEKEAPGSLTEARSAGDTHGAEEPHTHARTHAQEHPRDPRSSERRRL